MLSKAVIRTDAMGVIGWVSPLPCLVLCMHKIYCKYLCLIRWLHASLLLQAFTSLVLRSSMVVSVDVTSGIDTSTPASIRAQHVLVFSPITLPSHLVIGLTTILPGPLTSTICCQVLAINGLHYHPLDLLSASSYHMLGCGDLDLLLWISSFSS